MHIQWQWRCVLAGRRLATHTAHTHAVRRHSMLQDLTDEEILRRAFQFFDKVRP
jgi:hypothetical protein